MVSPFTPGGPSYETQSDLGFRSAFVDLHRLGTRCWYEPASRRLDGEIYCAIHGVTDWNPLLNNQQFRARERGEVLVEHCPGEGLDWVEAPPFTRELKYAEALLPEGLWTFYRDARKVCATALQARALTNEPPLLISVRRITGTNMNVLVD